VFDLEEGMREEEGGKRGKRDKEEGRQEGG
jgi:hypothetical protein